MEPSLNVEPEAGVQVGTTAPSTRSVADAAKVKAAPLGPVASLVTFAGIVRSGGVVSRTVAWNDLLAVLPCASVAEHVTAVVPSAKVAPEVAVQLGVTTPSTASVAEASNVTGAPLWPMASAVASAGTFRVGDF